MLKIFVALIVLIVPELVLAHADCTANPTPEWKSETEARATWPLNMSRRCFPHSLPQMLPALTRCRQMRRRS